jgi:hypothetical protein
MKKIGNNKEIMRNNESGKKSDGQRHHTDFVETSSPEARMDEQVSRNENVGHLWGVIICSAAME